MNEQAWRFVAKQICVAIAKLWLQELERQLTMEQESKVVSPTPNHPTVIAEATQDSR